MSGYAKTPEALAAALAEVYATLPDIACKGLCHATCHAIPLHPAEQASIAGNTGRHLPLLDLGPCSALTEQKTCGVYEHRPSICRLYGAVEAMRCPYGCEPVGGYLTDAQAYEVIARIREIGGDQGAVERIQTHYAAPAPAPFTVPAGTAARLAGKGGDTPEVITGVARIAGQPDKGPWRGRRRDYRNRPR